MKAAELAAHSGRVLGVGAAFFYDDPVRSARDEKVHRHDAALKLCPTLVFGHEHTDAFVTAFEETVREFC